MIIAEWTVEVIVGVAAVVVPIGCMVTAGIWWWQHRQDKDLRSMDRRVTTVETKTDNQERRLVQGDVKLDGIVHEMGKMNEQLGRVEEQVKYQVDAAHRTETKMDTIIEQLAGE